MKKVIAISLIALFCSTLCLSRIYAGQERTIHLTERNSVTLRGEITEINIRFVTQYLSKLSQERKSSNEPLYVVIDTIGGNVGLGLYLIQVAEQLGHVYFIVLQGWSMGGYIPQLSQRTRYMAKDGTFMIHLVQQKCQARPDWSIEQCKANFEQFNKVFYPLLAERLDMSLPDLMKIIRAGQIMSANEAKDLNMVDEIVNLDCSDMLKRQRISEMVNDSGIEYASKLWSGCPLVREPIESR